MNYDRYLNQRVASVPPSGIRRFFDLAASRKEAISLGVGEPDFKTPYLIRDAAINSLIDGETQYTANRGLLELRQEIAGYLSSRYQTAYQPEDQILVTIGASEAIDLALRALITPGDEVLVPDPSYVSYAPGVTFSGGVPVPVVTKHEDSFRLKADALEKAITPQTRLLILPYPNNPTGAIMERADLEAVAEVVEKHDLIVISDEIYSELIYDGHTHVSFASLPGMYERTITINGFSKAFAMTGWRVGYACGAKEIIAVMNKIHQYAIMCAPRQGQVAATAALRRDRDLGEWIVRKAVAFVDEFQRPDGYICTYSDENAIGPNPDGSERFCWNLWSRKYTLWALVETSRALERDPDAAALAPGAAERLLGAARRLMDHWIGQMEKGKVKIEQTGYSAGSGGGAGLHIGGAAPSACPVRVRTERQDPGGDEGSRLNAPHMGKWRSFAQNA